MAKGQGMYGANTNEQGKFGVARRNMMDDPLAPRYGELKAPMHIQGGGVGGVAGYDTSGIGSGQRAIASLLGRASTIYSDYMEGKKDQWELEGKLAYAQGKTEQEIRDSGNKYTLGGFLTMNVRTASNQFAADMREHIATVGKTQSPDDFRAEMSKSYAGMSEKVGSNSDPYVKQLLAATAEETMPKLVAEQTMANNAWKENETFNAFTSMGLSESSRRDTTVEHIREVISPAMSGLTQERHREAVIQMLKTANSTKNFKLRDAIAGMTTQDQSIVGKDLPANEQTKAQALSFVVREEGGFVADDGGKGPTLYGVNSEANPKEYAVIKAKYDAGNATEAKAMAREVFVDKYWKAIDADSLPADIAMIAFDGAVNQGAPWMKQTLKALAKSDGTAKDLIAARRERYIQIAKADPSKAQYLDGWMSRLDKLDQSENSSMPVSASMRSIVSEEAMVRNLTAAGFSASQIETAVQSNRQGEQLVSQEFDTTRIMTEQSIMTTAQIEGNFPARLEELKRIKEANGYSDAWATRMASVIEHSVSKYDESVRENGQVASMVSTSSLYRGTAAQQQAGIDMVAQQAMKENPDAMNPDSPNNKQAGLAVADHVFKFMYNNNVLDDRLTKSWEYAVMGDIVDGNGKVKPAAVQAYSAYRQAKNSVDDPVWAGKLLGAKSKDLFTMTDSILASDDEASPSQALITASAYLQKQAELKGNPAPSWWNAGQSNDLKKELIDKTLPGLLSGFGIGRTQAQMRWQINGDGVRKAATSREVTDRIMMEASRTWSSDKYKYWDDQAGAKSHTIALATQKVLSGMEYVAGTFVYTGEQPTISNRIGMGGVKNATNMVVSRVMSDLGPHIWKDFNDTDYFSHSQEWYARPPGLGKVREAATDIAGDVLSDLLIFSSPMATVGNIRRKISEERRGVPDFKVVLNPSANALILHPYTNYDRTQTDMGYTLPIEKLKEAASFLDRNDEDGYNRWIESQKSTLPKY